LSLMTDHSVISDNLYLSDYATNFDYRDCGPYRERQCCDMDLQQHQLLHDCIPTRQSK